MSNDTGSHLCGGDCEDNPTDECVDLARWNAEAEAPEKYADVYARIVQADLDRARAMRDDAGVSR